MFCVCVCVGVWGCSTCTAISNAIQAALMSSIVLQTESVARCLLVHCIQVPLKNIYFILFHLFRSYCGNFCPESDLHLATNMSINTNAVLRLFSTPFHFFLLSIVFTECDQWFRQSLGLKKYDFFTLCPLSHWIAQFFECIQYETAEITHKICIFI